MVNELMKLLIEKQQLEKAYGWQSCFDVPEQYERMEELATEAQEQAETISKQLKDTSTESLYSVCKNIADEVANGNISETADFLFYTQDEYAETFITTKLDEEGERMFNSLFYWMGSEGRGEWIKANYTNNDPNEWTDTFATFVIFAGH